MAFGSSMTPQKPTSGSDGEKQVFKSQWMPKVNGTRIFRILPALDNDGQVILTPRLSTTGMPMADHGQATKAAKKDGKVLMGPEPEEEVAFLAVWWTVLVDGQPTQRRLILDPEKRWSNPLWKYVEKKFEKGTPERSAFKNLCAMNVYDMTPVVEFEGNLFYPDDKGVYRVQATAGNGRLVENAVEGDSKPLNEIRILEISTGEMGGKHTFQQLAELANSVEDSDGLIRRLPEFDLKLRTQGSGIKTIYSIRNTSNFKPLPDEVAHLPRYNLRQWLAPWPDAAIEALLNEQDFNEVVEEHGITLFPSLPTATAEEAETNEFD